MLALLYQQILSAGYFYEQQAVMHNIPFPCTSGFTIYIYTYAALPNLLGSGKVLWYHSHLCWLVFEGAIPYVLVFIQKTFCDYIIVHFDTNISLQETAWQWGQMGPNWVQHDKWWTILWWHNESSEQHTADSTLNKWFSNRLVFFDLLYNYSIIANVQQRKNRLWCFEST